MALAILAQNGITADPSMSEAALLATLDTLAELAGHRAAPSAADGTVQARYVNTRRRKK